MAAKKSRSQQQTYFCEIFQYVESLDSEFAGAIRSLCMERSLRGAAVTFLYPKDAAFREEIIAKASGSEANEAVKMIESLIIPDILLTGEDWQRRPVGSQGQPGVLYEVASASGSSVTLKNGAKFELDSKFRPLQKSEGRSAVWQVVSGRPPLSGPPYKRPAPVRAARKVRGGAEGGASAARVQLAERLEQAYDAALRKDRARSNDPYLAKVVGLLRHLKANNADLFGSLLPLVDWCPVITFYLLVEPYKQSDFLIPDAILFGAGGWNGADGFGDLVAEMKAFMNSLSQQTLTAGDAAAAGGAVIPFVFRDSAAVMKQIATMRRQILGANGSLANKVRTPKAVQDAYTTLVAQNQIAGLGPILPDATLRSLQGGKKLWQDELRFIVQNAISEICAGPQYEPGDWASVVRLLHMDRPGNDYAKESALASSALLQTNVSPNADFGFLLKFINSTDFLYVPCAEKRVGGAMGDPHDPTDFTLYNRNREALGGLERTRMEARQLSAAALAELRAYVAQFGSLPPEVQALVAK